LRGIKNGTGSLASSKVNYVSKAFILIGLDLDLTYQYESKQGQPTTGELFYLPMPEGSGFTELSMRS
jgi:hypothetical protein